MCQPKFLPATPRAGASQYPEPGSKKRKAPPSLSLTGTSAGAGTGTGAGAGAGAGAGTSSRTRALTLEELQENFHLPINEVACKLGVCVTVLKQQCRELGIVRWPYRKVRKLDNMLVALESASPSKARPFALSNGEEERQRKISTVKKTLRELIADPNSCAHLKLGKVKGLKADGETGPTEGAANAEATREAQAMPGSPKAEKAAAFPGNEAPASLTEEEASKDALTSVAGLLKGVHRVAGSRAKCESASWLGRGDWEEEGVGSEGLAAGTPPVDDGVPLNRGGSGDGCDVMEAASALMWGRLLNNQAGKPWSANDEGNNTLLSTSCNNKHPFSSEPAAGTSFLSLLGGSSLAAAAVPGDKGEGAGSEEAHASRGAAVGAGHAHMEDEERPLSFSLGPPRPHSELASSRNGNYGPSRGWLSSYMPSSSSSSPDKGPCQGPPWGAQAPPHSTTRAVAATTTMAGGDPLPQGPACAHLRPCDVESTPEGSPAGRRTDLRDVGRLWGSAGEEATEGSGCAVELDLISRLEATQGVPGTAEACAPKAAGASGRTQGESGEAQQSPTIDGSPSPRLPSSPLEVTPRDAGVPATAQEAEQGRQKPQALKVELQSELLPAAALAAGGAGLPSLAPEDLLPQPMLLLGGYDGLRGLGTQPAAPAKTIPQPLAVRIATVLPPSQLATVLPAGQLPSVNALLLGRQGLGLGGGGNNHMLASHADALSLSRQHLALLQRQQQAQLLRMLAGSPVQHAPGFGHPSGLAAMGPGSQSIVDVLMAQRAAHF